MQINWTADEVKLILMVGQYGIIPFCSWLMKKAKEEIKEFVNSLKEEVEKSIKDFVSTKFEVQEKCNLEMKQRLLNLETKIEILTQR